MRILYNGKKYTKDELRNILTDKEWIQFVKKYKDFQIELEEYIRTDEKFQGIAFSKQYNGKVFR